MDTLLNYSLNLIILVTTILDRFFFFDTTLSFLPVTKMKVSLITTTLPSLRPSSIDTRLGTKGKIKHKKYKCLNPIWSGGEGGRNQPAHNLGPVPTGSWVAVGSPLS